MDPPGASGSDSSQRPSRYFQRGLCFYGDYCSYQHLRFPGLPEWAHHDSEPPATLPRPQQYLTQRSFLHTYLPPMAWGWSWGWWGSEPGLESLAREAGDDDGSSRTSLMLSPADQASGHAREPAAQPDPASELEARMRTLDLEGREDSREVVCGICMDKVWNKPRAQRVFAILPNCPHAHCLRCLRTWRRNRQHLPLEVIKACPQCRVYSSYIIPHKFWVSRGPRKEQLVRSFKARTGQIPCRFFMQRNGRCPFQSECIYRHQRPAEAPAAGPYWSLDMQLASRSEVLYPGLVLSAINPGDLPFLPFYPPALTGRGSALRGFLRPGSS